MMHPPIHNPMIPFIGPIFGGCQPGTLIDIQGHVPLHSNRFAVNIQCGPNVSPRDDVAFHINVDLLHNRIVRNSISQLNWGREEAHGYMPLTKGQPFSLVILCEPSKFNLAVNGVHFTEMSHRLPLHRVSHLAIDGDVTISSIQFSGGGAMPAHGQVGFNPTALSYTPGYNGHTPYPSGPGVPGQPYPMQQSTYPGQQPPYPVQPGMPGYGQPAYGYPQYPHSHTHKPTGILEKAGLALGGAGLMSTLGSKFGGGGHNNHYPSGGGYPHPHHGGGGSMLGMGATGLGAGLVGATLAHKLSPVSEFYHRGNGHYLSTFYFQHHSEN
uniref:Galectin n=1 Tax=Cacopsylla melanoneura TaxID=428564 RepID=A0A8D8S0M4_9HEMI